MAKVSVSVREERIYTANIHAEELVLFLTGRASLLPYHIPSNARVTVQVPGGGDYSGVTLPVDECGGITITWSESKS